jgi:hypothetical protein
MKGRAPIVLFVQCREESNAGSKLSITLLNTSGIFLHFQYQYDVAFRHVANGQRLNKHIPVATNTQAIIELLLERGCFICGPRRGRFWAIAR